MNKEMVGLKSDKNRYKIELLSEQDKIASMLSNGMGEDINNVLNGKVKVKLTLKEKIIRLFDRIINAF